MVKVELQWVGWSFKTVGSERRYSDFCFHHRTGKKETRGMNLLALP